MLEELNEQDNVVVEIDASIDDDNVQESDHNSTSEQAVLSWE